MPEIRHFSLNTDAQVLADAVKEDGAIIIDDVLSAEFITELRGETDPYMEGSNLGFDDFAGFKTTRTGGLMVRSQKCRELIAHPDILAPCKLFLEPYCQTVQLHLTQIIRIGPGETAQLIYRDRWAWGSHLAHVEPQFNTIWAITDFTSENGATQVVPGSTQWPDDATIKPEHITQAEMRAGSVLVYSGSVFHGGGENRRCRPHWHQHHLCVGLAASGRKSVLNLPSRDCQRPRPRPTGIDWLFHGTVRARLLHATRWTGGTPRDRATPICAGTRGGSEHAGHIR